MSKIIHTEEYKDLIIEINATYHDEYYEWGKGWTQAVSLHYVLRDKENKVIRSSTDPTTAIKEKSKRFLFWTIKPKYTLYEETQETLEWLVKRIKKEIDTKLYEKEVTEGLIDSLKNI